MSSFASCLSQRQRKTPSRGQTTVEVTVVIGVVVVALVVMTALYVQRAYQGYLYATASSQGHQFDPTEPFAEDRRLERFTQVQNVTVLSGQPAVDLFSGSGDLPSVPGGELPGRILATEGTATADWSISRDATYEAQ
jgi:hypothetical protein